MKIKPNLMAMSETNGNRICNKIQIKIKATKIQKMSENAGNRACNTQTAQNPYYVI